MAYYNILHFSDFGQYRDSSIQAILRRTHLNLGGCLSGTDFIAWFLANHHWTIPSHPGGISKRTSVCHLNVKITFCVSFGGRNFGIPRKGTFDVYIHQILLNEWMAETVFFAFLFISLFFDLHSSRFLFIALFSFRDPKTSQNEHF